MGSAHGARDARPAHRAPRPREAADLGPDRLRGRGGLALPSALLRAAALQVVGSGQGSVGTAVILAELPALAAHITAGGLGVATAPVPLAEVADAWAAPVAAGHRVVLTAAG